MLLSSILQVVEILTAFFFFFTLEPPLYGSLAFRLQMCVTVETSNI